jgi:hypothetical protein
VTPVGGDDMKVGNIACIVAALKYFAAPVITERLLSHTENI